MPIVLGRKGGASGGGAPSGPAGGDLSGTYPNPDIAAGTVGTTELSTAVALQLTDGWVDDTAATWTRTANQTFTVTGDRTAVFSKGTRLKWTQATVKYGVVVLSSHAAGTTTVTIATTADYVLTAAAISVNYYSYAANPQGYPAYFTHAPTYGGFSADPSGGSCVFSVIGETCIFTHQRTAGTSNATTFTLTLPVTLAGSGSSVTCAITNNSAAQTTAGKVEFGSATSLTARTDQAVGAWTGSGTKTASFSIVYRI